MGAIVKLLLQFCLINSNESVAVLLKCMGAFVKLLLHCHLLKSNKVVPGGAGPWSGNQAPATISIDQFKRERGSATEVYEVVAELLLLVYRRQQLGSCYSLA
jgi:hypothetical protein